MDLVKPLFSILIANYNNGSFIEECVLSLISQTYPNIEIICLDDGSNDNSLIILENLSKVYPNLKYYQNQKNIGCGYTKRRLCELAKGSILAFVDPEDTIVLNAVEIMVENHIKNPQHSLIYSTHYICDEYLTPITKSPHPQSIPADSSLLEYKDGCISHFASFKNSFYNQTIGINSTLKKAVDQDLYYKLEEVGRVKFIDRPLYFYRIHDGGISTGKNRNKAYLYHLQTKIAAYRRRTMKTQVFRHQAIYYKLQNRYHLMTFYGLLYYINKIL